MHDIAKYKSTLCMYKQQINVLFEINKPMGKSVNISLCSWHGSNVQTQ